MNIYKYIRSKDVREYNEKIKRKFTATESAFLVWLNYEITLNYIKTNQIEGLSEQQVKAACETLLR